MPTYGGMYSGAGPKKTNKQTMQAFLNKKCGGKRK